MRKRYIRTILGVSVLTLILGGTAIADHSMKRMDPNDTAGHLDVREWRFRVTNNRIICRADFFGDLKRSDWNDEVFLCGLDHAGGGHEDAFIRTSREGGAAIGELHEEQDGGFEFSRNIPAEINFRQDFAVMRLPRNEIMARSDYIRWRGFADSFTKSGPCAAGCRDSSLDTAGWYRYDYD